MTYPVSRRSLLALGAGLGASALLGGSALARAPKLGTQTPYWHRFMLGTAEVTVVSDGPLPLGPPKGTFTGATDDEIKKMLTDNFLPTDNIVLEQNSPVVNMGDKLVLFDTGMGTSQAFGPTTGRQQKSMAEAGIKPEDIDAVVFSHAHIDHIGGVVDASGKVLFPNAQFYIAQSDLDYWTDEGKLGSPLKDFVIHARKNLLPVRDKLVFYKDGEEFLPGIQALAAARPHRRPHHVPGDLGRKILRLPRRSHPPPDPLDGTSADGILLRHRSEAGRGKPGEDAGHAGSQQDPRDVVSLPVAGLWPCGEDRRGFSLYPRADADVALSR
jgi:glyoxylase-like metal-dependent hydrolase (beta-lactamase superfamily II)